MNNLISMVILLAAITPVFAYKDVKPDDKTQLDPKDPVKLVRDYMKKAEQGLSLGQASSGTVVAQEEAMILLDKLIKAAEKQQKQQKKDKQNQQQKNKSNNQQKKQQEQQKKEQQKQEQKKQQQEKDKQEKKESQSDKPSDKAKPGDAEIQTAEDIEAKGEEWGSLPPQLRRELIEGLRENLPEKYKELLKLYYIKLSEIE